MKKLSIKTLITLSIACMGLFGIVRANEVVTETTQSVVSVAGEFSTDFIFGDATMINTVYTGLILSGDGWVLSTNLTDGMVHIEEAKYSWMVVDGMTLTFGSQAEPYGLAWGLHRPSNNWFASTPREHMISNGVGFGLNKWGVGADMFWGGDSMNEEMESELYWAGRFSYGLNLLGIDSNVGLSLNSNESQLVDVSMNSNIFESSLEYDLSEEADGAYWMRGVITPTQIQGAFLLIGLNSEEVVTYGVGYKCSDKMKVVSEFKSGLKDSEGNDVTLDFGIRASYSF